VERRKSGSGCAPPRVRHGDTTIVTLTVETSSGAGDEVMGSVLAPQSGTATRSSGAGRYAPLVRAARAVAPPDSVTHACVVPQPLPGRTDVGVGDQDAEGSGRAGRGEAGRPGPSRAERVGGDAADFDIDGAVGP
jgi:hypothetical protein